VPPALGRLKSFLQLASNTVHDRKPIQDVQMPRRPLEPLTKLARPLKSYQSFIGNRALRGDETRTQHEL